MSRVRRISGAANVGRHHVEAEAVAWWPGAGGFSLGFQIEIEADAVDVVLSLGCVGVSIGAWRRA